jgi:ribonuclease E
MTDETTTRTRRRVRVRDKDSSERDAAPERTRARGRAAGDDDAPDGRGIEEQADTAGARRRRVRRRDTSGPADDEATPGAAASATPSGDETSAAGTPPDERDGGDAADAEARASGEQASATDTAEDGNAEANRAEGTGQPQESATSSSGRSGGSGGSEGSGRSGTSKRTEGDDDTAGRADGPTEKGKGSGRSKRSSGRNRRSKKGRGQRQQGGSGSPRGGVSEEVRRSVTEGPPRRMLVSVKPERTEVAVLEERDLVEHYVTRKAHESYVGNIYLGRVQNVLPGMEAAFVDIGKGRNGVLYAGEVNYDDEDVEAKAPRIEQALKPGQTVVVQVTKDPMGTKGARLTQQLSLAGRYCVLAIEDGTVGISRKLTDAERDDLRETLKEIKPDGYGLIVRTAASGATREQLRADVERLVGRWEQVQERLADAKPLTEVYREPELAMRVIRDVFGTEYTELICDDRELTDQIRDYLDGVSSDLASTVSFYQGDESLFDAYEVTNQVRRALEKKVWLASGGYLIIEKTEAMWVIDVNTGKFVGDSNLEETVLKNNLEAAEEIARQLRLRDMGGIIVIDFVDMLQPVNRDEVLKRFKRELARDKTKSRVMEISKLGLVQMTRKNVSQGLTETFTRTCECCEGRGAQIVDKALQR